MKKFIAVLWILCICLSLVACEFNKPVINKQDDTFIDTPDDTIREETEQDQTPIPDRETDTEEIEEITLGQFLAEVGGIWIFEDTLWFFDDGGPCFEVLMILEDQCTTAVYPGGVDRPGLYEGFTQIDENTYRIALLYEETPEESYYGYMPEDYGTITFVLTGNGTMKMKFGDGLYNTLIYGGQTFEEADAAARERNS